MPKNKPKEAGDGGLGDWSSTGTFLRKPATGWLHEERELMGASFIGYQVQYLGCVEVKQSMRTLQYNVRTQVTKEAIMRIAEEANRVQNTRKRKVPKQVQKLLGEPDMRWAGDVDLAVCVDYLKISSTSSGREIMNHSLPSISFASGGDGPTLDFIGYVAKDPVHQRACHVFECPTGSQYVLTTIGQAFELRYKIHLKSPRPTPVEISDSMDNDAWGQENGVQGRSGLPLPPPPVSVGEPRGAAGIYSDIPEFPSPDSPLTLDERPRAYSSLPGFPTEDGAYDTPNVPRLQNPYDTMETLGRDSIPLPEQGVYSDPGEVTCITFTTEVNTGSSPGITFTTEVNTASVQTRPVDTGIEGEYSTQMMTIRQLSKRDASDQIDLTPHDGRDLSRHHPYANVPVTVNRSDDLMENRRYRASSNDYEDADMLGHTSSVSSDQYMQNTPMGTYDNPGEVFSSLKGRTRGAIEGSGGGGGACGGATKGDLKSNGAKVKKRASNDESSTSGRDYCNQDVMDHPPHNQYDTPMPLRESFRWTDTPKFDDTIYAMRPDNSPSHHPVKAADGTSSSSTGAGKQLDEMASMADSLPDPLMPLAQQQYFHGSVSRVEAEALLEDDGEFLIRESSNKPGQCVLTGLANGQLQHLLLMDKHGKIKSRDHEFESVPHLVHYFMDKKIPLVIGYSQVYLKRPVINAFPSEGYN